jgi:protein-disulfide isomerase
LLTALVGGAICLVLLQMGGDRAGGAASSLCTPTETVNCGHVLASRWSQIASMPTALVGLMYFACQFVWYLIIGIPNRRGRAWQLLVILSSGVGLLGSGFFLFVMSQLPVWCTWCVAAHVANLLMFALAIAAWFVSPTGAVARPTGTRVGGVAFASLAAVGMLFLAGRAYTYQIAWIRFQRLYLEATNDVDYIAWKHATAPQRDVSVRDNYFGIGPADAPHTLVVFSDFECGQCAVLHTNLFGLSASFPDALRIVLKHYPVCRDCNEYVRADFHYFACDAAIAAEAARLVGDESSTHRYWKLLFDHRERLDERPYLSLAKMAGLHLSTFEEARRTGTARERVAADIELAHALGVEGTPAMFLDGRRLTTWNIMTDDLSPRPEKAGTLRLWERLLGVDARQAETPKTDSRN